MKALTGTRAHGKTDPLVGAVESHIEAFHDCCADHQPVYGGGDAESEAVQCAFHVCDQLDIELPKNNDHYESRTTFNLLISLTTKHISTIVQVEA